MASLRWVRLGQIVHGWCWFCNSCREHDHVVFVHVHVKRRVGDMVEPDCKDETIRSVERFVVENDLLLLFKHDVEVCGVRQLGDAFADVEVEFVRRSNCNRELMATSCLPKVHPLSVLNALIAEVTNIDDLR